MNEQAKTGVEPEERVMSRRGIMLAFALSGASALVYEVVWTRQLSLAFGSTVYAVSTMLAAFMSGLSLGGWLGGKRADSAHSNHIRDYMLIELFIAVFGALSIPLMAMMPRLMFALGDVASRSFVLFLVGQFVAAFAIMLIPTTLMGATFPIVSRLVTKGFDSIGSSVGNAYSINTLGSILGSASAGFFLIPLLGVRGTVMVAIALNTMSAMIAGAMIGRRRVVKAAVVGVFLILCTWAISSIFRPPTLQASLLSAARDVTYSGYLERAGSFNTLYDNEGVFGRVSVLEDAEGYRMLQNGPMIEGSTYELDINTTALLAVLPYEYASAMFTSDEQPKNGLVVGLGTGFTSQALLDLPLERVDTIEINPSVVTASRYFVGDELESDKRWHLIVGDARWVIAAGDERYDVITSEPSWPVASSVTPMFTAESYESMRDSLTPDGVIVQWLPQYLLKRDDFDMMYRTFAQVFPNNAVWVSNTDLLLVGTGSEQELPATDDILAAVQDRLGERIALEPFGNTQLLADAVSVDGPVNTDDHPRLETVVARNLIEQLAHARSGSTAP